MTLVLVTGAIGSGKSALCDELAELGAEVVRADELVHTLYRDRPEVWALIENALERDLRLEDGSPDKRGLAAVIFTDAEARAKVEAIVHPLVRDMLLERIAHSEAAVLCVENAVEGSTPLTADFTVVVTADPELRLARLLARGLSKADAEARMKVQAESSLGPADFEIPNNAGMAELAAAAADLYGVLVGAHD